MSPSPAALLDQSEQVRQELALSFDEGVLHVLSASPRSLGSSSSFSACASTSASSWMAATTRVICAGSGCRWFFSKSWLALSFQWSLAASHCSLRSAPQLEPAHADQIAVPHAASPSGWPSAGGAHRQLAWRGGIHPTRASRAPSAPCTCPGPGPAVPGSPGPGAGPYRRSWSSLPDGPERVGLLVHGEPPLARRGASVRPGAAGVWPARTPVSARSTNVCLPAEWTTRPAPGAAGLGQASDATRHCWSSSEADRGRPSPAPAAGPGQLGHGIAQLALYSCSPALNIRTASVEVILAAVIERFPAAARTAVRPTSVRRLPGRCRTSGIRIADTRRCAPPCAQIRHVPIVVLQEAADHLHAFVELVTELLVLLVAPGGAQGGQLIGQRPRPLAQIGVELLQTPRRIPAVLPDRQRLAAWQLLPIPNYSLPAARAVKATRR